MRFKYTDRLVYVGYDEASDLAETLKFAAFIIKDDYPQIWELLRALELSILAQNEVGLRQYPHLVDKLRDDLQALRESDPVKYSKDKIDGQPVPPVPPPFA